jgi:hypothetical protein
VKPGRGTDESAVPLSRPLLGPSLSASGRSKTALMLSPDLQGRLALLVRSYSRLTHLAEAGVQLPILMAKSRTIWHRKTSAFDFTLLGPRVSAVVVSPCIPAGTVDTRIRDHASVPATVRAIFAPDAAPLTARDAWAAAFHSVLTLDRPRGGRRACGPLGARRPRRGRDRPAADRPGRGGRAGLLRRLPQAGRPGAAASCRRGGAGDRRHRWRAIDGPGRGGGAAFAVAAHRHRQRTETR